MRTLRVSAVLAYTDPPIWRKLELASDLRLDELHGVLQAAFEWDGGAPAPVQRRQSHLGRRECRPSAFGPSPFRASPAPEPESKTRPSQVLAAVGDRLDYLYDFGDSWEHVVMVEEIFEPEAGAPRARVVDGDRAAPFDDCGGVPGYEELLTAPR